MAFAATRSTLMRPARGINFTALLTLAALTVPFARADVLVDLSRSVGPEPETQTEQLPFELRGTGVRLCLNIAAPFRQGGGTVRVLDPNGQPLRKHTWQGRFSVSGDILGPIASTGQFSVELSTERAVGRIHVALFELPQASELRPLLLTGPLMVLVALGFVAAWKLRSRCRWRWFWAGAGIWAVGVALKFAWSLPLNRPILHSLEAAVPRGAYLVLGGIYVGLLTGVFEIGITLLAARIWWKMADTGNRAVSVGIGAGAFEALLLGVLGFAGVLVALSSPAGSEAEVALAGNAYFMAHTPLLWLAGPVERFIAILCHTSSRTLVLLSVATRRRSFFWYGFLVLTAIDSIAGVAHVSGELGRFSMWWIELALAPFAIASLPMVGWCLRHWPAARASAARPAEPGQVDGTTTWM